MGKRKKKSKQKRKRDKDASVFASRNGIVEPHFGDDAHVRAWVYAMSLPRVEVGMQLQDFEGDGL